MGIVVKTLVGVQLIVLVVSKGYVWRRGVVVIMAIMGQTVHNI